MNIDRPFMTALESKYQIRPARFEELPLLSQIENSAAALFLDTPYAFLVNDEPLSLDFVQQQFHARRVWVAVDCQDSVVGYAVAREVDETHNVELIKMVLYQAFRAYLCNHT